MSSTAVQAPRSGLDGFDPRQVFWNLGPAALYEEAIRRREATLTAAGVLVARTTPHTGRSPNDKFIVDEPATHDRIGWGTVNRPLSGMHHRAESSSHDRATPGSNCA